MLNNENLYANAFNHLPGLGSQRLKMISRHFKRFIDAWQCQDRSEFLQAGLPESVVKDLFASRDRVNPDELSDRLQQKNIALRFQS